MIVLRNMVAGFFLALCFASPARSTDFTDLWWNPNESGWGLNIAHQADTIFITLYVYGSDNRATWFTSTAHFVGSDQAGNLVYTGDLYQSTGPWYGALFFPSQVMLRRAGDATFRATSVDTGNITYSVDGIVVSKDIQRLALKLMDISGDYIGGIVQTNAGCSNPASNGSTEDAAFLSVTQNGVDTQIVTTSTRRVCTYHGTYGQAGRMGNIGNGTFTCSDGTAGTFSAFEIDTSTSGFLARFSGAASGCNFSGDMGGVFR